MQSWPTVGARRLLGELTEQMELLLPKAAELRRQLHAEPRLSGAEADTAATLRHALLEAGATDDFIPVADTGFLHRVGPATGPAIGLRAEMDALPIIEETGVSWAGSNRAMHACGHDVHMAAAWTLLAAAQKLDLPVALLGVFQPREESQPSGAEDIVKSGVLQEQDVRAMLGAHVQPRLSHGLISTGIGGVNASADELEVNIYGSGGHGAYPHVTVDPISVLGSVLTGLNELTSRMIDPTHATVVGVGQVWAGSAGNVIPNTAHLKGIIRATTEEDRQHLHNAVRRLVHHTAEAKGAEADVVIIPGDPVLSNDRDLVRATDAMVDAADLRLALDPFRSCGADDFSHYSAIVPILMMFVGTNQSRTDDHSAPGLHHSKFLPTDESIRHMAMAMAASYIGSIRALHLVNL